MTISDALAIYGKEHAPTVSDPQRIGYAISALDRFWGGLSVSSINEATCRRYAETRMVPSRRDRATGEVLEWRPVADGTIRRELGALAAAIEYCRRTGHLLTAPAVKLPPKPESKQRWLSRDEAARLLWAAWRNPRTKHLARFILIGLYTGTRKAAILGLQYGPNTEGGWVDLENGLLHRRGVGQRQSKKRQTPAPLPRQLKAHLRRWQRAGHRYVVSEQGARIGSIKTAWRSVREAAELGSDVVPHTLRHTAVTWAMQRGAEKWDVVGYFGLSMETLERTYAHHHPDHQSSAVKAMERRR